MAGDGMPTAADTIFALSSGRLPAGIAVLRLSGDRVRAVLASLAGDVPAPRRAVVKDLRDPADGSILDQALLLYMPGPGSVTGEDVGELHLHGGRAVVEAVSGVLRRAGLRAAEPGEFTRRAYVNGILDITQAEGIADLVAAETDRQRRQALVQSRGDLGARYEAWRQRLLGARALVEAELDFADGEEIGETWERARHDLQALRDELRGHLDGKQAAERLREGLEVVLIGAPNAGKSSLLNRLAGRDVAIVTAEPGTTRDLVEVRLDLDGVPVTVVDTAGLREVGGLAEAEGIRRGQARAAAADLVIEVVDLAAVGEPVSGSRSDTWRIGNKLDLIDSATERSLSDLYNYRVSATGGEGIDGLMDGLTGWARERVGPVEDVVITRARHRAGIADAVGHLEAALGQGLERELAAEELRLAADALGRVTGRIDVEDILGSIFAEFCIGK